MNNTNSPDTIKAYAEFTNLYTQAMPDIILVGDILQTQLHPFAAIYSQHVTDNLNMQRHEKPAPWLYSAATGFEQLAHELLQVSTKDQFLKSFFPKVWLDGGKNHVHAALLTKAGDYARDTLLPYAQTFKRLSKKLRCYQP